MSRARKVFAGVGALLAVGAIVFFGFVPQYVESTRNVTHTPGPWPVSDPARDRHEQLFVVDMHTDSLLWDRNLERRVSRGHVDFPRQREGGVDLQAYTVVTKSPKNFNYDQNTDETDSLTLLMFGQLRPPATWTSLEARAHHQAKMLTRLEGDGFRLIRTARDLDRFVADEEDQPDLIAGWLGLEGCHALEGDLDAVDRLFDSGFRMMAPVHFFDNEVGGSAHGVEKGGLTEFGKQVIRRQEELGIAVDLAHASPAVVDDVLAMATRPVVSSHTGVRGTCDRQRNLSDEQLRGIARTGGVVGIAFFEEATCGEDVASAVRAIRYAVDVAGIDHVAFGSDFDGSVATPWDITGMPQLTEGLRDAGFTGHDLDKLAGGNVVRVLRQTLPKE